MLSKFSFLINLLIASVLIGLMLMALGATTLGGWLLFGGAGVAYLGLMLVT
jgi:hypothetical protein